MEQKPRLSAKFYAGVSLIVLSLIIGKITLAIFVLHLNNVLVRWGSLIMYMITWPMLILGIWWVGEEYYSAIKKYLTYRYYHEKVYHHTKHLRSKLAKNKDKIEEEEFRE